MLTSRLDGRALAIDPGLHEFAFGIAGAVFARQKILILQGQRNRPIVAALDGAPEASPAPAPPPAPAAARESDERTRAEPGQTTRADIVADARAAAPRTRLPVALAIGGTGLGGLATGALLVYWGRKDNDLLGQCANACPQASVDHIKRLYLGANVAFGVGVAALAASYWVFAAGRSSRRGCRRSRPRVSAAGRANAHRRGRRVVREVLT